MVRVVLGLGLLGVVGAFAASCTPAEPSIAEANWLAACDGDSDCKGVASCFCGVCTKECTGDATCIGVGTSVCVRSASPSLIAICGENTGVVSGICLEVSPFDAGTDGAGHLGDGSALRDAATPDAS
jgi:hypothetical protein